MLDSESVFARNPSLFRWSQTGEGEWRIGYGASSLLVARGSAWSCNIGEAIFAALTSSTSEISQSLAAEAARNADIYARIKHVGQ
jgi:hypothetical protein